MTTVVLLRHGQSMGNVYSLFLGHTDLGLSELGKRQAEAAAEYLSKYEFDVIYASDLCRAMDTARPTAERRNLEIIPLEGFREIYAGEWEKKNFDDLAVLYPKAYGIWKNDIGHATPTGGESVYSMAKRVYAAFDKVVAENDGKTVLIATHATPIRLLECRFLGRDVSFAGTVKWAPNASVTEVTVDNGKYDVKEYGYDGFLGKDTRTALPINV